MKCVGLHYLQISKSTRIGHNIKRASLSITIRIMLQIQGESTVGIYCYLKLCRMFHLLIYTVVPTLVENFLLLLFILLY